MSEKSVQILESMPVPGEYPSKKADANLAAGAAESAAVHASTVQPPAAFGGHRGGGKRRADGLPAGSPEAKEADRKKDRDRKARVAAAKQAAALPPALPSVATPAADAPVALAGSASGVPVPAAGALVPPATAPMFVEWSQRLLEKPAKLITKILDRARCWSLMKKVRQLNLTPEQEREISSELKWKDETVSDFTAALSECATVELNKRRIPGAQNSHWINLAMCGGELALVHFNTLDRLEKMVAENEVAKRAKQDAEKAAKKN